jgi:hypothetical protein
MFLAESDMELDVETVALRTLLSASGVPTAILSVTTPNESANQAKICKNKPLYIFVTSGPAVQEFLKQVRLKPNQGKLNYIFTSSDLLSENNYKCYKIHCTLMSHNCF